jgi:hypothetical protein
LNLSQVRVDDLEEILRRRYRDSLGDTARSLLSYPDINAETHSDIIQSLEAGTRRKLIVCPRGALKSTLCDISYPIWLLLNNPNLRILIDSEIFSNSKTFLREIKAQLESERLVSLFGPFKSESNWTEASITIKQRTIARKEPSIQVSGIGAVKVGQHYDVIIMDDMNSNNNSATPEGRQKVIDHYKLNTSILEPDGTMVIVGTRYAENDLIGHVLQNELEIDPCSPM